MTPSPDPLSCPLTPALPPLRGVETGGLPSAAAASRVVVQVKGTPLGPGVWPGVEVRSQGIWKNQAGRAAWGPLLSPLVVLPAGRVPRSCPSEELEPRWERGRSWGRLGGKGQGGGCSRPGLG